MRKRAREGFSLLELLVVIGIIALLIGILVPTLSKSREAAARAECMSNVRQLVTAANVYMANNKGMTPAALFQNDAGNAVASPWGESIGHALEPYLDGDPEQLYRCPSAPRSPDDSWAFSGDEPMMGGESDDKFKPNYFYMATFQWHEDGPLLAAPSTYNWYPHVWATRNAASIRPGNAPMSSSEITLFVDESTSHHTNSKDIYNRFAAQAGPVTDVSHFGYADGHVERKRFKDLQGYLSSLHDPIPQTQTQFGSIEQDITETDDWPERNTLPEDVAP